MNYLNFVQPFENAENISDEWFFERIRNWRNAELASCDWTQVADSTADKASWALTDKSCATYQQATKTQRKSSFQADHHEVY